ncbi:hypothetical protein [Rathayibacter caricis]|uniref:hypothetical protein n=1 Tax=Rathayibacter caricis TaxID=110936 RepID=UPI0011B205C1|nr:hypothetical protein [Rathayibacter caricis]
MLDIIPKARGKCGSCGQQIAARKIVGQTRIVTPEQADVLKAEETALRARRKYLHVRSWQVNEPAWDATAASLAEQYGRPASLGDAHWRLMNEATLKYQAAEDWARTGQVYSDMSKFLVENRRGWVHTAELRETMTQRWHLQYHDPATELVLIARSCGTCAPDQLSVSTLDPVATSVENVDSCTRYHREGLRSEVSGEDRGRRPASILEVTLAETAADVSVEHVDRLLGPPDGSRASSDIDQGRKDTVTGPVSTREPACCVSSDAR